MDDRTADAEANRFAIELLMPRQFIEKDMEGVGPLNLFTTDGKIAELAKRYEVPEYLMILRLQELGYLNLP